MTPEPVHVDAGFGWTAAGAWMTALVVGLSTALGVWLRQIGPWRKIKVGADERLRDDLIGRVEKLENMLAKKDAIHSAERALDRHRINNLTACLDALLLLIEQDPSKSAEAASRIREMRNKQVQAEALEKATVQAATIAAEADTQDSR